MTIAETKQALSKLRERADQTATETARQIAVLESQLPSDEMIEMALIEVHALISRAQQSDDEFAKAWVTFLAELDGVAATAQGVAATRTVARMARLEARDVIAAYALSLSVPPLPDIDPNEIKVAASAALIARGVAFEQALDDAAERELAAARANRIR
jgi:hypothetical protein